MPAYWVALTVTAVWVGTSALQYGVFTAHGAPLYYLLGQTYSPHTLSGGLTQAWTLTIEVAFYAFLPVYAWIQRRIPARSRSAVLRSELIGLLVLIVISQIWKAIVLAGGNPHQIVVTPMLDALPSYFDQFAFGMGLALLSVWIELEGTTPRRVRVFDRYPGLAWLFAALAFWAVATQIGLGRFFAPVSTRQYFESHWLYTAVAFGLLLPAVVGDQTAGRAPADPELAGPRVARAHLVRHLPVADAGRRPALALALRRALGDPPVAVVERRDVRDDRRDRGGQLLPARTANPVVQARVRQASGRPARGEATDEPAPARPLALVLTEAPTHDHGHPAAHRARPAEPSRRPPPSTRRPDPGARCAAHHRGDRPGAARA